MMIAALNRLDCVIRGGEAPETEAVQVTRAVVAAVDEHDERQALADLVSGRKQERASQLRSRHAAPFDQPRRSELVALHVGVQVGDLTRLSVFGVDDPEVVEMLLVGRRKDDLPGLQVPVEVEDGHVALGLLKKGA